MSGFNKKPTLKSPRFANPDACQPNGEGVEVRSYFNFNVNKAIDGNRGLDGTDNAAHPESGAFEARLFVELEESIVDYVMVWPRKLDFTTYYYYEGMKIYAGSVSCPSEQVYNTAVITNVLTPNNQALIFSCPSGTEASIIQLTPGNAHNTYRVGILK